jgi:thiol:disulfide interchange protein
MTLFTRLQRASPGLVAIATAIALLACNRLTALTTGDGQTAVLPTPEDVSPAPDEFTIVRFETAEGQLESILKAEAQKAQQLGRAPFVEFYADWCGPCIELRDSLNDPRMVDAFSGTYIIQLNLDAWQDKLSGTGFNVLAIPVFFEIDSEGKPTGRTITGGAWGDNIPENMAPPLKSFFQGDAE